MAKSVTTSHRNLPSNFFSMFLTLCLLFVRRAEGYGKSGRTGIRDVGNDTIYVKSSGSTSLTSSMEFSRASLTNMNLDFRLLCSPFNSSSMTPRTFARTVPGSPGNIVMNGSQLAGYVPVMNERTFIRLGNILRIFLKKADGPFAETRLMRSIV